MDAARVDDKSLLFQRYYRSVLMILRKRLAVPDDAEDLTQETFRLGFQKIDAGELKDPAAIGGFFAGIARNLALNQNRTRQRWQTDEEAVFTLRTEALSPLDALLKAETKILVQQLLKELTPERDRAILRAYFLEQKEKSEICSEWHLDSIHFNRVIHRAKTRFRHLLEKKMQEKLR